MVPKEMVLKKDTESQKQGDTGNCTWETLDEEGDTCEDMVGCLDGSE